MRFLKHEYFKKCFNHISKKELISKSQCHVKHGSCYIKLSIDVNIVAKCKLFDKYDKLKSSKSC